MQHTYLKADRIGRWWLRRNALGVFNALRPEAGTAPPRCAPGLSPAEPFARPGEGKTLQDLEREGEQLYGRHVSR